MSTAAASPPVILPKTGTARVQSVLSGDTVVLLGRPTGPNKVAPQVVFTFSSVMAPVSDTPTTQKKSHCGDYHS